MKTIYSQELVDQINALSAVTGKMCVIKQSTPTTNVKFYEVDDDVSDTATTSATDVKVVTLGTYPFKTKVLNSTQETINEAISTATYHIVGSIVCGIKEMEDYNTVGIGFRPELDVEYNTETKEILVTAHIGYTGLVKD